MTHPETLISNRLLHFLVCHQLVAWVYAFESYGCQDPTLYALLASRSYSRSASIRSIPRRLTSTALSRATANESCQNRDPLAGARGGSKHTRAGRPDAFARGRGVRTGTSGLVDVGFSRGRDGTVVVLHSVVDVKLFVGCTSSRFVAF